MHRPRSIRPKAEEFGRAKTPDLRYRHRPLQGSCRQMGDYRTWCRLFCLERRFGPAIFKNYCQSSLCGSAKVTLDSSEVDVESRPQGCCIFSPFKLLVRVSSCQSASAGTRRCLRPLRHVPSSQQGRTVKSASLSRVRGMRTHFGVAPIKSGAALLNLTR
jgi:hypothetical protein